MLKKVLCVVLSLVLTLGVVTVAGFAATADDLAAEVAKLPSDYNAQFYNDTTVAAIQAAKDAAAKASSASEIDAAMALCATAYDLVTETAEDEFGGEYYVNRDETKAVVNYNISTDTTSLEPGDTFDVTVSIKTNFYVGDALFALAYDRNVFTFQRVTQAPALVGFVDIDTQNPNHMLGRADTYGFVPMEWNYEDANGNTACDTYNLLTVGVSHNFDNAVKGETKTWYPEEETEVFTLTFKVADDATDCTAKLFIDDTVGYHYFEYETDYDFYEKCFAFTRGWDDILYPGTETVRYDGSKLKYGSNTYDNQAQYDQTMVYGGENATPYTSTDIYGGEEVAVNGVALNMTVSTSKPADYAGLDAAIAKAAEYSADDYTDVTYAELTKAVEAGNNCARDLQEADQGIIDALETAIYDAIDGLKRKPAADCPITAVAAVGESRLAKVSAFEITVKGEANKIRFVDSNGNTFTYTRDHANVTGITANGDGTETWSLNFTPYKVADDFTVYAKYKETGWNTSPYYYEMLAVDTDAEDARFISADITDDYEGVIYAGVHEIVVETGLDVTRVQFMNGRNTWTFSADSATYVDAQGVRTWTINMNFAQYGEQSYAIRTRTLKTAFTDSGASLDVLVYAE